MIRIFLALGWSDLRFSGVLLQFWKPVDYHLSAQGQETFFFVCGMGLSEKSHGLGTFLGKIDHYVEIMMSLLQVYPSLCQVGWSLQEPEIYFWKNFFRIFDKNFFRTNYLVELGDSSSNTSQWQNCQILGAHRLTPPSIHQSQRVWSLRIKYWFRP